MRSHPQRLEPRCTGGREWIGLGRLGREAYMQVYMYKNKFWDKFSKKPNNKFIHVDLHVGFPARATQADSFSAARTPRVLALLKHIHFQFPAGIVLIYVFLIIPGQTIRNGRWCMGHKLYGSRKSSFNWRLSSQSFESSEDTSWQSFGFASQPHHFIHPKNLSAIWMWKTPERIWMGRISNRGQNQRYSAPTDFMSPM